MLTLFSRKRALVKYYFEFIYFLPQHSLNLLLTGLFFISIALFYSVKSSNYRWIYLLLFIGFVFFGSGFATIDPYLHEWDEQYHALVAKNLSFNPFKPVLINESPIALDFKNWTYNKIWLHKQPLFLWQIALSIKTFGVNIWAVRFPSILLHALTALMVFSISKRFLSNGLALVACVLFGCSGYYNDYISGAIGMDHNDVAFLFYVTASFWAWIKYSESDKTTNKWIFLIGLFAGLAILCKWLVGLIVFSGWGIVLITSDWKDKKEWFNLLKAFTITLLIVIPWQLYCYMHFPTEYFYEITYNSKHFSQALEAHSGDTWFYWNHLKVAYGSGEIIRWILLLGLALFIPKLKKNKKYVFTFTVFLITYLFFTLAATKLQGYVTIVAAFGFIFLLYPFELFYQTVKQKKRFTVPRIMIPFAILAVLFFHFSPKGVIGNHKYKSPIYRETRINELNYCLNEIHLNSTFTGYFVLKNNKSNIVTSLLFSSDKRIIEYNHEIINNNKINLHIIDCKKIGLPKGNPID